MPVKTFLLFADGTGNSFTEQESNVWRIYNALDKGNPAILPLYIEGVGTSAIAPLAHIDAATGFGVPGNVRKLYNFLCWNYEAGDTILMFGFSRGSFTIRALIGLINSQGLVPRRIDGFAVTHADMRRNVMSAWRAYRAGRKRTFFIFETAPTIWLTRWVRDFFLWLRDTIFRHKRYSEFQSGNDKSMKVAFIGLFDTVEAYGVPFEQLRKAIDWAVWPISFKDAVLPGLVENARHALAIDDERTTFHPLRFSQTSEPQREPPRIQEVWFAGMHSDLGGGYKDGSLSFKPLLWMIHQASPFGLKVPQAALDEFATQAASCGPMHDSRGGFGILYRYEPRQILGTSTFGGPPVIHHSVVERIVFGTDAYAPIVLPAEVEVQMPGGTPNVPISGFDRTALHKFQASQAPLPQGTAEQAIAKLCNPDPAAVDRALGIVRLRQILYYVMLAALGLLVSFPAIAPWLGNPRNNWLGTFDQAFGTLLRSIFQTVSGYLPFWSQPHVNAIGAHPLSFFLLLSGAAAVWHASGELRDRIHEQARLAWTHAGRPANSSATRSSVAKTATAPSLPHLLRMAKTWAVTVAMLFLLAGAGLVAISRVTFELLDGAGYHCKRKLQQFPIYESPSMITGFTTKSHCFDTGFTVEKGIAYRIAFEMKDRWFDRAIFADIAGFSDNTFAHLSGWFILRNPRARWFAPIARIGEKADAEWPLVSIDGSDGIILPRQREGKAQPLAFKDARLAKLGHFDELPQDFVPEAERQWDAQNPRKKFVADFVAAENGPLFIYVNDAVLADPVFGTHWWFYCNNRGSADITIQRRPLP